MRRGTAFTTKGGETDGSVRPAGTMLRHTAPVKWNKVYSFHIRWFKELSLIGVITCTSSTGREVGIGNGPGGGSEWGYQTVCDKVACTDRIKHVSSDKCLDIRSSDLQTAVEQEEETGSQKPLTLCGGFLGHPSKHNSLRLVGGKGRTRGDKSGWRQKLDSRSEQRVVETWVYCILVKLCC